MYFHFIHHVLYYLRAPKLALSCYLNKDIGQYRRSVAYGSDFLFRQMDVVQCDHLQFIMFIFQSTFTDIIPHSLAQLRGRRCYTYSAGYMIYSLNTGVVSV